jgi:processive 1,2-diacylglycerol beta-glucosyltransferase
MTLFSASKLPASGAHWSRKQPFHLFMRVLIATATAGGGHLAAAAALQEAWSGLGRDDVLEQADMVHFFSPLHRKIHSDGYAKLVEHAPEIWGLMFNKTDDPKSASRLTRVRRFFTATSRLRFRAFLGKFQPDLVLCTHYLPLETLREWRAKGRKKRQVLANSAAEASPAIVSVVTDFEAHALWMDEGVNLYCVAAEETRGRLIARGAEASTVIATGIPISKKFSSRPDPAQVRQSMGLRDDQPVILVLSGGFGMGPVAQTVAELDKVKKRFQVVVVTGRNQELRRELATVDRDHPTHILGFSSNMHELMAVADLIITKPGGLTSSEALAMGKPLLILSPIPGQEAANSDFLLERGAAAKANRVEDLSSRVEQLLGSSKLKAMGRVAGKLGRPAAAHAVCAAALELGKTTLAEKP